MYTLLTKFGLPSFIVVLTNVIIAPVSLARAKKEVGRIMAPVFLKPAYLGDWSRDIFLFDVIC
jgi:hypothetical protein